MAVPPNMEQQNVQLPNAGRPKKYDWGDGKGKVHSRAKKNRGGGGGNSGGGGGNSGGGKPVNLDPLTRKALSKLVNSAANLEYGEQERALGTQMDASAQRQIDIGSWYDTYLKRLQAARDSSAQMYQAAPGAQPAAPIDPNLSPEAQQAALNAQGLAGAFNSMMEGQGKALTGVYDQQKADSGLSQLGWSMDEGRNADRILKEITALKGEKGQFKRTFRDEAIQRERQYGLDLRRADAEEMIAMLGAQNDAAAIDADLTKNDQSRTDKRKSERNTPITSGPYAGLTHGQLRSMTPAEKKAYAKQQAKINGTGGKSDDKGGINTEGKKARTQYESLDAKTRQQYENRVGKNVDPTSWKAKQFFKQAYDEMIANDVPPEVARAVIQSARLGAIGPKTRKKWKNRYGWEPKSSGPVAKAKKGPPTPAPKPRDNTLPGQGQPTKPGNHPNDY